MYPFQKDEAIHRVQKDSETTERLLKFFNVLKGSQKFSQKFSKKF